MGTRLLFSFDLRVTWSSLLRKVIVGLFSPFELSLMIVFRSENNPALFLKFMFKWSSRREKEKEEDRDKSRAQKTLLLSSDCNRIRVPPLLSPLVASIIVSFNLSLLYHVPH